MNQPPALLEPAPVVRSSREYDRTTGRHAVDLAATLRVSGTGARAQVCRLRHLSLGGGFVELRRMPLGTQVQLAFYLPAVAERLSLDASVRWATHDGVGVVFDGLRAQEVWVLWHYLEAWVGPAPSAVATVAMRTAGLRQRAATVDGRSGRRLRSAYAQSSCSGV